MKDLQKAFEDFEKDLVNLSDLLHDIAVHAAALNVRCLYNDQPTVNIQPSMTLLREVVQDLDGQLETIDYDEKPHHDAPDAIRHLFSAERMMKIFEGFEAATELSHGVSNLRGWWKDREGRDLTGNPLIVPTKIALMHSELTEALEAHRTGANDSHLPHCDGFPVELADLLHRVFDVAGAFGLDLATVYAQKGKFNAQREDHSLTSRSGPGGKAY